VAEFLVEVFVQRDDGAAVERNAQHARVAAEEMTRERRPVRYLQSIFGPDDETCFLLYEADSIDAVREAAQRAGVAFERIAEATARPREPEPVRCP
jgi:hypothetical protein